MKIFLKSVLLISSITVVSDANALFSTKYTNSCRPLAKESGEYPKKKIKGFSSESLYKKMQEANQAMADGNKVLAKQLLTEVKDSTTDGYPLSVVYQYFARMEYEVGNFNGAVNNAKKVIDLDALPVQALLAMKKQVAYAYLAKKDIKNAIKWMNDYFAQVIKPPVSDYKTLAQLYYQDKQYKNAVCPAYIALKGTTTKKDKEPLYKMLFGLHFSLSDLDGSAKVLSEMINFWPQEKKYWEQLFSIHYQRGDTASALAVNELAYKKGIWEKESEYKNLASLHANTGAPLTAALRLEDGIKKGVVSQSLENLKLVARYWEQAKDRNKAISAYTKVANADSSGEYFYRIGNMYFEQEKYNQAIDNFAKAINKGKMKSVEAGYSRLQKGAAHFYLGQEDAAIAAMNSAKNFDKTKKQAISWIGFIREKQRIREELRKDAEQIEAEVAAEKAESENRTN
ncbi:tetratricopeptide repeat protein [Kangiella sp. HZ709]|uniref:tetratricopeptide repeat protein n=1 Tax=Kangiella sp. HZ709 TaxID=2666328 RepID=UPI0012AF1ABA|nr:tetratricopeptide repeat protein [Kangiella sp. HZ709]MRX28476.1 hypothetical protein [Kangiella sp. HZ709]